MPEQRTQWRDLLSTVTLRTLPGSSSGLWLALFLTFSGSYFKHALISFCMFSYFNIKKAFQIFLWSCLHIFLETSVSITFWGFLFKTLSCVHMRGQPVGASSFHHVDSGDWTVFSLAPHLESFVIIFSLLSRCDTNYPSLYFCTPFLLGYKWNG